MASFPTEAWIVLGLIALTAVTAMLYALASLADREVRLHDLKGRVRKLRSDRLSEQGHAPAPAPYASLPEDLIEGDFEYVDDRGEATKAA